METSHEEENLVSEQSIGEVSEQSNGEVYDPPNGEVPVEEEVDEQEEEEPVAEVVDEAPNEAQVLVESNVKVEEVSKKSYASIVRDFIQSLYEENAFQFMCSLYVAPG